MAIKTEETEQLTVSGIPVGLVRQIERLAFLENRPRNRQIVELLKEIVALKREEARATA